MDDLDFDNFDDFGPEEVRYLSHKLLYVLFKVFLH